MISCMTQLMDASGRTYQAFDITLVDVEDSSRPVRSITTLQPLPTIDPKDKGKGILQETESVEKTKKKVQGDAQMERDAEARMDVDYELAARMT
ncbi:hypothetical protein Tco_1174677 [Tanacetum coccineum]